ncbi:MAG: alpha/beta fold hydrolase [Anaerolineales bacterium]
MNNTLQIIPTAEPFFFPGKAGQPGCLLIHGFTGAPKEMRWMGEYLNALGYPCLGVRLTGHATRPEDMIRSRYTDWMASVEDGYHFLHSVAGRIYLVGLSMGGILALVMSARLPVAGVIAMSTPYRLPYDYPVWALKLLSKFVAYQPKDKDEPGSDWFDKQAYAEHVSYPQNPVRSGAELQRLLQEMRATLPNVQVPALLIHSRNDTYVPPENMEQIYAALGASDKTKLYITEAGHVVTRDAAREEVFRAAAEFICRVEAGA